MATPTSLANPLAEARSVGDWIKQDGFLIVFGSVVLVFGVIFMTLWLKQWWHRQQLAQDHSNDPTPVDLLRHVFFGTMDLYLKTKVLSLSLPEKGRELIFRDFLKIKFQTFTTNVYSWLVEHQQNLNHMDAETLNTEILKLVANGVQEYETRAEKEGIPHVVVERFRKFHNPHVDFVSANITNVCQCEWLIVSNTERMGFILNSLMHAFEVTLIDAEAVLCDINGELDGVVYKGVTVQPYKKTRRASGNSGINPVVHH